MIWMPAEHMLAEMRSERVLTCQSSWDSRGDCNGTKKSDWASE